MLCRKSRGFLGFLEFPEVSDVLEEVLGKGLKKWVSMLSGSVTGIKDSLKRFHRCVEVLEIL